MTARTREALEYLALIVAILLIVGGLCAVDPCDINPAECQRTPAVSAP